jgi:hypothetical protein
MLPILVCSLGSTTCQLKAVPGRQGQPQSLGPDLLFRTSAKLFRLHTGNQLASLLSKWGIPAINVSQYTVHRLNEGHDNTPVARMVRKNEQPPLGRGRDGLDVGGERV